MERELNQVIRQKIIDALAASVPAHTRRDVHLPGIKGKAMAVIGMRRSGKTIFLWQCLADRLKAGTPRDALLYFNFEDERLAEMTAQELQWVVEEYFSLHPERRDSKQVTFFLDEIQEVPGWETFVRRLLDTEKVELFLSGSSARLLSREVATSMRGRATFARHLADTRERDHDGYIRIGRAPGCPAFRRAGVYRRGAGYRRPASAANTAAGPISAHRIAASPVTNVRGESLRVFTPARQNYRPPFSRRPSRTRW